MLMLNLVGRIVRLSPQDKKKVGNTTGTLAIVFEFFDENVSIYNVQDIGSNTKFQADAEKYDQLFIVRRKKVLPKNTKDKIYNPGNPDYQK
jgi:hypothetical protein